VAEAMKEMKYVNMFNQGIKRVQDMLVENGNNLATFDVSKLTVFCVEVPSTVDASLYRDPEEVKDISNGGGSQGGSQGGTQGIPKDEELEEWIIKQISQNKKITIQELADKSGKSYKTIHRKINKMLNINYVGTGYSGYWEID
jgi:ATP-dependent DNA helicase RecG